LISDTKFYTHIQEVLGRLNSLLSLIHGPHRKRRVQQFFYGCMYSMPR
jgi:hypothetical protein